MNNWTTILTFEYPQDAQIPKLKLESEGIQVFLKDELTIQTDNLLSSAMGGVKLQVREEDYDQSLAILIEGGFMQDPKNTKPSPFWLLVDRATKGTFLKNFSLEIRLIMVIFILILLVVIPMIFIQLYSGS